MTCLITGVVGFPDGSTYPNAYMYFERIGVGVVSQGGAVVIPEKTIVRSDGSANVSFSLLYGVYQGTIQTTLGDVKFKITVPDDLTADFGFIIGDFTMPIFDANVQLVLDARDDTVLAAAEATASAASAALYDGPWLDTVAAMIADTSLTYTPALPGTVVAGDYVQTRKEGFAYRVAASGASDQHVTTAGGVKLYVMPQRGGHNVLAWGARRAEDSPGFDNSDVFDRIVAAIEAGTGDGTEFNLLFPPGLYLHSRTFKIRRSHVTLTGLGSASGSIGFSPQRASGAHMCYTGAGGGVGIDIGNDPGGALIYRPQITNMRFGGTNPTNRNQIVMRMRGVSEWFFSNVTWQVGNVLLDVMGCSIGFISNFNMADSTVAHVRFSDETGYPPFLSANSLWMTHGNFWMAEEAFLLFEGCRFTSNVVVSLSFMERSKSVIRVRGGDYVSDVSKLTFNNVEILQDATYGGASRDGWLLDAVASQTFTSRQLRVSDFTLNNCTINATSTMTGDAIKFTKGSNVSGGSYLDKAVLNNCFFKGSAAYTIIDSDTGASTAWANGSRFDGSKTWSGGPMYLQRVEYEFARTVFNGNAITLPQGAPFSAGFSDGQIWWDTGTSSLRITKAGASHHVPLRAAAQADSSAATVAALVADFNALLAKLRLSGAITP